MNKKTIVIIVTSVLLAIAVAVGIMFFLTGGDKYIGKVNDAKTGEPLSGVAVTDGRNVVKTAQDGTFSLEGYRKTRFIIMTVPSGYRAAEYYIPASKDVESYDFKLDKEETPTNEHVFLQIADTEIGEKGVGEWIEETKRLVEEYKPRFLIHTGDICYEAGLKQHIKDMNSENMGCEVKYIIGNHDYVKGGYGEKLFETNYGPIWYSFDVGNVHYVVTPIQYGDVSSGYNKNDRWRWLENDLANTDPDKKVVIFNHTNAADNGAGSDYVLKFDRKELDLKKHNLQAWIFGHYHHSFINENNGVLDISTARPDGGGIDQSPSGSRIVNVSADGKVSTELQYYDLHGKNPVQPENTVWSTNLSGNVLFSDALKINDKIFVGTIDDDYPRDCGVYSVDANTGAILWEYKTENSIKNDVVYHNGKIIAQDCEGRIYCLDENTGKLIWQGSAELKNPVNSSTGICVDGDVVFVGSGQTVSALDVNTGKQIWKTEQSGGEMSAASFVICGDNVIVSIQWGKLYALNKTTGEKAWEIVDPKLRFRSSTPYCGDDSTIFAASTDSLFNINGKDGTIINQTLLEDYNVEVQSKPLVENGVAYVATANKGILAFDTKTLKTLWSFETKRNMIYTSPYTNGDAHTVEGSIISDGTSLLFGASDGYVYAVDKATGKMISETYIGSPVLGSLIKHEDSVISSDFSGRVLRFKIQTQ